MPDFKPYPDEYPDIYDRYPAKPDYERALFRERTYPQAAEINEEFSRADAKRRRLGNLVARDGDRISGADLVTVDRDAGTFLLTAGEIYVRGDRRSVAERQFIGVPIVGDVAIGVRLQETLVDHIQDPDLLGLHPDTEAELEPGAARLKLTVEWGWAGDGEAGELYQVYLLRDGYVIDQSPPPLLTGVRAQIAVYDHDAHGNYIADGCFVAALGKSGNKQMFSISEGVANILGFKYTRNTATRFEQVEAPETETVEAEVHAYVDTAGSCTITTFHSPINGVTGALVETEITETLSRGNPANTADLLSNTGVLEIVSVSQNSGATTYAETADFILTANQVDWSPGGAEPGNGESYDVTYRYLASVTPTEVTATTVTVANSGAVEGGQVQLAYLFNLPRIDRICFDQDGQVVYLPGVSSREQPVPPWTPSHLLALCQVKNNWVGPPEIDNDGTRDMPFWQQWRMYKRVIDLLDLTSHERLRRDIAAREPNAKHSVFVDPFRDGRYRDSGEAQTALVFNETCQIRVDPNFEMINLPAPVMLDYTDEIVVDQPLSTSCMKINPYQVFPPPPLGLRLTPSEDFWEVINETWLDDVNRVFAWNSGRRAGTEVIEDETTTAARFLRQIPIQFEISGLGEGETVPTLTFDGIDVNPGSLAGNAAGTAGGQFTIPENVTVGVKEVAAVGGSGSEARARFEGRGTITDRVRQRINTTLLNPPPPNIEPDGGGAFGGFNRALIEGVSPDPLAQTFLLQENRHIAGVDVKFCAIGNVANPVICEIVTVDTGHPTTNVIAQSVIDMSLVTIGEWTNIPFDLPPFLPGGIEFALVFKTEDADHSLAIATRGDFDEQQQEWMAAQAYIIGVLLSSSNARTWTAHQDSDLTFRLRAAVFDPVEKVVNLGTFGVTQMSDFMANANVELPTAQTSIRFRVTPDGETPQLVEPGQNWERNSYFTGNVLLEAVLNGATKVSPILGRDILAVPGTMQSEGVYFSRRFDMGQMVTQFARIKTDLPAGSALKVEIDKADDALVELAVLESETLNDGTFDRLYRQEAWDAPNGGRVKLTLTGTPAARPVLWDLRSYSM